MAVADEGQRHASSAKGLRAPTGGQSGQRPAEPPGRTSSSVRRETPLLGRVPPKVEGGGGESQAEETRGARKKGKANDRGQVGTSTRRVTEKASSRDAGERGLKKPSLPTYDASADVPCPPPPTPPRQQRPSCDRSQRAAAAKRTGQHEACRGTRIRTRTHQSEEVREGRRASSPSGLWSGLWASHELRDVPPSPSETTVKLNSDEQQKRGNAPQRGPGPSGGASSGVGAGLASEGQGAGVVKQPRDPLLGVRSTAGEPRTVLPGRTTARRGSTAHGEGPGPSGTCEACSAPAGPAALAHGPTCPSFRPPSEVSRNGALPKVTWSAGKQEGSGAPNRAWPGLVLDKWGPRLLRKDTYRDGPEQDERLRGPEVKAPGKAGCHSPVRVYYLL